MASVLICCVAILYSAFVPEIRVSAQITTLTDLDSEFANIFDAYFDKQTVVPLQAVGSTMAITVDFDLVSIVDFDDDIGSATISGYLIVKWAEERYTTITDDIDVVMLASSVWTPPLIIVNTLSSAATVGSDDDVMKFNLKTAQVVWKPRIYAKVICYSNAFFPFDKQECSMKLSSLNFEETEMKIAVTKSTVGTSLYIENGLWNLKKSTATNYSVQSYPYADFQLTFQRKSQYMTFVIVSLMVVISVVHLLIFLLPQGPEKINYGITSMLGVLVVLLWTISYVPLNTKPVSIIVYYLIAEFLLDVACLIIALKLFKVFRSCCNINSCLDTVAPMTPQKRSGNNAIRQKARQGPSTRDVRVPAVSTAWDDEVFEEDLQESDTSSEKKTEEIEDSKNIIPPTYMFMLFLCLHILFTMAFFVSLGIDLE